MIVKQLRNNDMNEFRKIYVINSSNCEYKYFIKIAKFGLEELYMPLVSEIKIFNDEYSFVIRKNKVNNLNNNYFIDCYKNLYSIKNPKQAFPVVGCLKECEMNKIIFTVCAAITNDILVKKNRIILDIVGAYD